MLKNQCCFTGLELFLMHCGYIKLEIRGSHGNEDIDCGLLDCDTMLSCKRNISPPWKTTINILNQLIFHSKMWTV
jgi:hypothetical protein